MIIEIEDDVGDKVVVDTLKEILLREDGLGQYGSAPFLYALEYFLSCYEYEEFLRELDECKDL